MRINQETVGVSIGATQGAYQALDIARRSGGTAVVIGNDEMMRWQQILSSGEGLYVEPASAAAPAAVEQLSRAGSIGVNETVVALLTASGLKDPAATALQQDDLIVVPANINEAIAVLKAADVFPRESLVN
jgi:threonine synthase